MRELKVSGVNPGGEKSKSSYETVCRYFELFKVTPGTKREYKKEAVGSIAGN